VVGVLPVVRQSSLFFGRQYVSLPWFDQAGVLADDAEARTALVDEALRLSKTSRVRTLQLRHVEPCELSPAVRTDKCLMRLELPADSERLWKALDSKVRNQVRKPEKSGLTVEGGGDELIRPFFEVYSRNMRDLGSPSHHRGLFEAVWAAFPNQTRIYVVRFEGVAVGAGWTMANGDTLEIPWASSVREYNTYCVNHLMYWHVLRDACQQGFRRFHFGRSTRDSGTYHFKAQWKAEPVQLHWYFLSPNGAPAEVQNLKDSYGWATRMWQRLPLWLARRLGPRIIAKVP